jgi:DNA-binding transcriptional LysR family regulator
MRINVELSEVQAFVAVAEKGSFRAAAESLFISQPALSRRIEKLEAELESRLIERTTRRVALTESGRQFLAHAQVVLAELEKAVQGMSERTLSRTELVTVGCVPSVANNLLPKVILAFVKKHPNVRVKVIDESAGDVLDSVVAGRADFGINFIGTQEAAIDFRAIFTERYVLVVPPAHKLAKRRSIAWSELAGERLISVSQSSGNRMLVDNALARVQQRPLIFYETNHVVGALGLVAAGLGMAVLPELALSKTTSPRLTAVELTNPVINRTLGLIKRKGGKLHPAAQDLSRMLEEAIRVRR